MSEPSESEEINVWKTKQLLKGLRDASGNGTSMVTIILRPGESISAMNQKLAVEYGTASNIKSRVNRQSVESAIVSAQQRLKLYNKCPPNGLAIFSGEVVGEDRKERKVVIDFEPFKPINTTLYMCDNRFHIEALEQLLVDEKIFIFVIVDGNGYDLFSLSGNTTNKLDSDTVSLPSKTRRGGQSSNRFARIRDIQKAEWIKKVCERLKKNLVENNFIEKVQEIVLAGNADIKHELFENANLDPRIKSKMNKTLIDVPYGGPQGFHHAVLQTKDYLGNVKFVEERNLLEQYFERIARDGNVSFGVEDTIRALEEGAAETLILWEGMTIERWTVVHDNIIDVRYDNPKGKRVILKEDEHVSEKQPLLDWFVENHKQHGADIKFVSDYTSEGSQFSKGFGGVGAFLRYKMDFNVYEDDDDDDLYLSD